MVLAKRFSNAICCVQMLGSHWLSNTQRMLEVPLLLMLAIKLTLSLLPGATIRYAGETLMQSPWQTAWFVAQAWELAPGAARAATA